MSTVIVTNMPFWSERVGAPRTLGVEFPFGHILGQPHNKEQQRRVILQALDMLEIAQSPGMIACFQEKWPASLEEGLRVSHPPVSPPIGAQMGKYIGKFLLGIRREGK
jgi:hypothetical protein